MPQLSGLLLPIAGSPLNIRIGVSRSHPTNEIKTLLGAKSDPVTTTCKIGVMYSSGGSCVNALASSVYSDVSGHKSETHGPCFLVGEDEKGGMANLSKESLEYVAAHYQKLTGQKPTGLLLRKPKKDQKSPKKPSKAREIFKRQYFQTRSAELRDQKIKFEMTKESSNAVAAWNTLPAEQKGPYIAQEAADRFRYENEMAEWVVNNPPKPSRPRTATFYYHLARPEKEGRAEFSTLSEEDKQPFELKAHEDKKRYEVQLDKFKEHCVATGKDFEAEMKVKKRASKSATPGVERTTKNKTAEPSRKTVKKQKAVDGQAKPVKAKAQSDSPSQGKNKKPSSSSAAGTADKKKRKKSEDNGDDEVAAQEEDAEEEPAEAEAEDAGSDDE